MEEATPTKRTERSSWLRDLYEQFSAVRQEAEQYGEDEINASIDAAVVAVRCHPQAPRSS